MTADDREDEDGEATLALVGQLERVGPGSRLLVARALDGRHFDVAARARLVPFLHRDLGGEDESVALTILKVAAQALMAEPADLAFRGAEPMLSQAGLASARGRDRAVMLLQALEDVLAAAAVERREPPDGRFRALCEALLEDGDLRNWAEPVIDGFRYLAGEPAAPQVLDVDLGEGGEPPFPFLVAGFVSDETVPHAEMFAAFSRRVASMPPGVCAYYHQYGGYSCNQASLVGYGVDVPDDAAVRAAIEEMSDHWWESSGETIEAHELARWDAALRAMLPGGARGGHEAFLRSAEGAPISSLRGLPIVRPRPDAPWRTRVMLTCADHVTRAGAYGDEHERALAQVGADVGMTPIVALLWGNSD